MVISFGFFNPNHLPREGVAGNNCFEQDWLGIGGLKG